MKCKIYSAAIGWLLLLCGWVNAQPVLMTKKPLTLNLASINPGRYDSTWWNRQPYRLVQTNLREIDALMDVNAYVQSMVDASASIVLINVGGIVANYPTKLPYEFQNTFMKGDLVGDLVKGLHAKGIRVIGRFDFSKVNEKIGAQKPEWLYKGTDSKPAFYNGQVQTCPNGGYQQEYGFEILKEAINKYPFDGIFFNMIGYQTYDYSGVNHGICQCDNCKKRFKDSTGHPLPTVADMNDPVYREYNTFKLTTAGELFRRIEHHIRTLNPRLMINTYTEAGTDMIASESGADLGPEYEWNYFGTGNVKRVLGSFKDRSPGNLLIYFQDIGYRHIGTSPNLAKVWMLESMLHGAPLGFVVVGTLVNYEDRVFIPTLNEYYGFHKQNEKLFTNVQSVNKVAILRGSADEEKGIIKMLTEEHVLYDIVEPWVIGTERMPRPLQDYEALILGDVSDMDDWQVEMVDEYVKNGGKIIATGFCSTKDKQGKPLNAIRLQSLGVAPGYSLFKQARSTYLKVSPEDKEILGKKECGDFSLMMMYSDMMEVQPQANAVGYLQLVTATMFGPPEKCYFTPDRITNFPGMVTNSYGKGKAVLIPWKIGTQYTLKGNYAQRILFLSALRNVLQVANTIETNAPPLVEVSHLANRAGAFEWIGMINHSGQIGGSIRESIPIYNTTLRFRPAKPVKAVNLMRSGQAIFFQEKDGWIEATVPQLNDFEMLVCTYR